MFLCPLTAAVTFRNILLSLNFSASLNNHQMLARHPPIDECDSRCSTSETKGLNRTRTSQACFPHEAHQGSRRRKIILSPAHHSCRIAVSNAREKIIEKKIHSRHISRIPPKFPNVRVVLLGSQISAEFRSVRQMSSYGKQALFEKFETACSGNNSVSVIDLFWFLGSIQTLKTLITEKCKRVANCRVKENQGSPKISSVSRICGA